MTKVIAVLLAFGQFEVAVETSKGYFVGHYPDTETGVTQFLRAVRVALKSEPGRFYSCVGYEDSIRELVQSPLAERIGLLEKVRTGLRSPGLADAPWVVGSDHIRHYLAGQLGEKLDARLIERICLSLLPHNYKQLYPATAGAVEFYR
jgi:hypothetical protein